MYDVKIELDESGTFIIYIPGLKGCHSYGKTLEEAGKNIQEAFKLFMENEVRRTK